MFTLTKKLTCHNMQNGMEPPEHETVTPDKLPDPWLVDSEWLLKELAKARESILRIPLGLNSASDIKSAVDRIWALEQQLRYLLHLHRDGQRAFVKKANQQEQKLRKRLIAGRKSKSPDLRTPEEKAMWEKIRVEMAEDRHQKRSQGETLPLSSAKVIRITA